MTAIKIGGSMLARRSFLVGAALSAITTRIARADTYPSHTIKIIVPTPAGGPVDTMARIVANALSPILGQPVVIENRAGAGNTIGSKVAAAADPDGYTLIYTAASGLIMSPMLLKNAGYTAADFAPVAIMTETPSVLVVHPKVEAKTLAELIALAKANPGKFNYSTGGAGTLPHLTAELFKKLSGTQITHVPYHGGGPALADVVAGQVQMTFDTVGTSLGFIRDGRLRALALVGPQRIAQLPDVPAMPELGFPTLVTGAWTALLAPKATSPEIVTRLNAACNEALKTPAMQQALERLAAQARGGGPDALAKVVAADTAKWRPIVQELGLQGD
jgi:tripartite-type tricarboxylate transporter receptor subunit TctC